MSTVPVSMLRTELTGRLDGVERRVRLLALAKGAGVTSVAIATTLGAGLLVDAVWDVPPTVRMTLLGIVGLVTLLFLWRQLLRPILLSTSSAEVAALVEAAHPELQERLTCAVELSDPDIPERDKGSPLMREMLLKQTERVVARINVSDAAAGGSAGRWGAAGVAAILALLAPFVFFGAGYNLLLSRFFAPWENLERATNLYFEVEHGDRTVARGSDVEIAATPQWRRSAEPRPSEVWLNLRDELGETDSRRMVWNDGRGAYLAMLPHVFQPFDFNVSAAGARTRDYHVNVAEAPALLALSLTVDPPAYAGRPREVIDGAVGEVSVLEGSRLSLQMRFNKPLTDGALHWSPDPEQSADEAAVEPARPAPQTLAVAFADDRSSANLEFRPEQSGALAILLTDEFGLHNQHEPVRRLRVIPDAAPSIQFTDHNDHPQARPIDIVRVPVAAVDDIGIASLQLHYEVINGGDGSGSIDADTAVVGGRSANYVFLFDLKPLGLPEGSLVSIRARAADERPVPGPNEAWTETRLISISEQADPYGAQEVAERQQQMREILESLRQAVVDNRDAVEGLRSTAADDLNQQKPFEQDGEIPPLAQADRDLAQRVDQLAALFELHPLFANLAEQTRQVGREPLTNAAERLDHAVPAPLSEKVGDLQQASQQLTAAADSLKNLQGDFEKLAALEQDLLELQRLADQTQRLATDVASFDAQRTQPQRPNQSPALQQARRERLAAEHQRLLQEHELLTGDLDGLLERRPELVDAGLQHELDRLAELAKVAAAAADREQMLANALRNEAEQQSAAAQPAAERQQEVLQQAERLAARPELAAAQPVNPLDVQQLRDALDALKQGNTEAAAAQQESAARALERLAEELARNAQLPSDPQQAARELAQRQRDLQREMQQATAPPGAETSPEQNKRPDSRELAAAQGAILAAAAQLQTPRAAQPQREQATSAAGESLEQLRNNQPQDATGPAGRAAEALDQLAERIGTPQERRERVQQEVARLQQTQHALSQQVAEALRQQPDVPPEQTAGRLAEIAPRQQQVGEQLAGLDAPGAEPQRAAAAGQSARAQEELNQPPSPAVAESQRQTEQALSDLDRALRGEPSAAESVAALQERQSQIATTAQEAAQNQNQAGLSDQAAAQQQLADDLGRISTPAAEDQRNAAQTAAKQAAEALRQAASDPAQTAESTAAVDRATAALGQLADQLAVPNAQSRAATNRLQTAPGGEPTDAQNPQSLWSNNGNDGNPTASQPEAISPTELAQAAAELARQQRSLANQSATEPGGASNGQPQAENPMSGQNSPGATPDSGSPAAQAGSSPASQTPGQPTAEQPGRGEPPVESPNPKNSRQERPSTSPMEADSTSKATPSADPAKPDEEKRQIDPAQTTQSQNELAREAAELALETAQRTGPDSEATQQARACAACAGRAAQQAGAGQLSAAAQSAAQAAEAAQQAAQKLQNPQPATSDPQPDLGRQAEQLAERQQQAAKELNEASQSPAARRAAQQQGQQQLAQATQELSRQIADVAERLASEPIQADGYAQQANRAGAAAQQAQSAMQSAASQLSQQNLGQAAQSAQQAADALRQAAGQPPQSNPQQPETAQTQPQEQTQSQPQDDHPQNSEEQKSKPQDKQSQNSEEQKGQQQNKQPQSGQSQGSQQQDSKQQNKQSQNKQQQNNQPSGNESQKNQQQKDQQQKDQQQNQQQQEDEKQQPKDRQQKQQQQKDSSQSPMGSQGEQGSQGQGSQGKDGQGQGSQGQGGQGKGGQGQGGQGQGGQGQGGQGQGGQGQGGQGQGGQGQGGQGQGGQGQGGQGQGGQGQGGQGQGSQGQGGQGQGDATGQGAAQGQGGSQGQGGTQGQGSMQGQSGSQGQGGSAGGTSSSPISGEVGGQVTEAARQLREAGELLQQAGPPGSTQRDSGDGQPGQPGEGSEGTAGHEGSGEPMDGQGPMNSENPSASNQAGEQSSSDGKPESAAEALQQAAAALQSATEKLQPSGSRAQQPGGSGSASQGPPSSSSPGTAQDSSHSGGGTRQPVSLVDLDAQLKELSTRNWGELPGTLKTELQNTTRKRPDGDYARLIKLYFEEISRRQAPTLDQPPPPTE